MRIGEVEMPLDSLDIAAAVSAGATRGALGATVAVVDQVFLDERDIRRVVVGGSNRRGFNRFVEHARLCASPASIATWQHPELAAAAARPG